MAEQSSFKITTAPVSRADEIAGRQRRYVISMLIRTVCFIGAVAVGDNVFRWILLAGAVFLPYVAVVFANTATPPRPSSLDEAWEAPAFGELPPPRS